MVEVICDTSFLIHLSTRKIKNIDSVNTEIGQIQFVVPSAVLNEQKKTLKPILEDIQKNIEKNKGSFKFTREESRKTGEG